MPRDPNRIPVMLKALEEAWTKHPDQRLGQLIRNATGDAAPHMLDNPHQLEDDKMLEGLQLLAKRESIIGKRNVH